MTESILNSTKKILQIDPEYTAFDLDIITHINSAFMTLNQLGVGPEEGFAISDATEKWDSLLGGDLNLNVVKTYVAQRVRLMFDPPTTSYLITAVKEQIQETEWRLRTQQEGKRR